MPDNKERFNTEGQGTPAYDNSSDEVEKEIGDSVQEVLDERAGKEPDADKNDRKVPKEESETAAENATAPGSETKPQPYPEQGTAAQGPQQSYAAGTGQKGKLDDIDNVTDKNYNDRKSHSASGYFHKGAWTPAEVILGILGRLIKTPIMMIFGGLYTLITNRFFGFEEKDVTSSPKPSKEEKAEKNGKGKEEDPQKSGQKPGQQNDKAQPVHTADVPTPSAENLPVRTVLTQEEIIGMTISEICRGKHYANGQKAAIERAVRSGLTKDDINSFMNPSITAGKIHALTDAFVKYGFSRETVQEIAAKTNDAKTVTEECRKMTEARWKPIAKGTRITVQDGKFSPLPYAKFDAGGFVVNKDSQSLSLASGKAQYISNIPPKSSKDILFNASSLKRSIEGADASQNVTSARANAFSITASLVGTQLGTAPLSDESGQMHPPVIQLLGNRTNRLGEAIILKQDGKSAEVIRCETNPYTDKFELPQTNESNVKVEAERIYDAYVKKLSENEKCTPGAVRELSDESMRSRNIDALADKMRAANTHYIEKDGVRINDPSKRQGISEESIKYTEGFRRMKDASPGLSIWPVETANGSSIVLECKNALFNQEHAQSIKIDDVSRVTQGELTGVVAALTSEFEKRSAVDQCRLEIENELIHKEEQEKEEERFSSEPAVHEQSCGPENASDIRSVADAVGMPETEDADDEKMQIDNKDFAKTSDYLLNLGCDEIKASVDSSSESRNLVNFSVLQNGEKKEFTIDLMNGLPSGNLPEGFMKNWKLEYRSELDKAVSSIDERPAARDDR